VKNGWRDGQDVKRRKRKGRERNDAERKKQIVPVQAQHRTLTSRVLSCQSLLSVGVVLLPAL